MVMRRGLLPRRLQIQVNVFIKTIDRAAQENMHSPFLP